MLPLTKELKSYQDTKVCYICGKRIFKKLSKSLNHWKVIDHCHYTGKCTDAAGNICNLKFNVPNEIPVVFHNGLNDDYHFIIKELVIIKELANEYEEQIECLVENTEKYNKTFSIPIEKQVTNVDKENNESVVTISYKIKFIDSARFMATSLPNLVDNLTEVIHKIK